MAGTQKHMIGMLMGVVVILVDLYWTYLAYSAAYGLSTAVYLGIIIFIASLVWLWADM